MLLLSAIFTGVTALLHLYFLVLEMFFWTKPLGRKVFKTTAAVAEASANLAANQGLYNGLLAVGLISSFFLSDPASGAAIQIYCLLFIFIAGCYGAYTLSIRVFFVQSLPALIALTAKWMAQ